MGYIDDKNKSESYPHLTQVEGRDTKLSSLVLIIYLPPSYLNIVFQQSSLFGIVFIYISFGFYFHSCISDFVRLYKLLGVNQGFIGNKD